MDIAASTELRTEAHVALPVLKAAALQLAGVAGIRDVIGRRFALYPPPDRSEQEWAAWWGDYYDTLSNVTWAALEAAMKVHVANPMSEFMPKPGKLLELSKHTPNKTIRAYERATAALIAAEPAKEDDKTYYVPSDEEKAQVKRMLASFKVKVMERAEAHNVPPMPSIHGMPDEGGITPQMRALLARQNPTT